MGSSDYVSPNCNCQECTRVEHVKLGAAASERRARPTRHDATATASPRHPRAKPIADGPTSAAGPRHLVSPCFSTVDYLLSNLRVFSSASLFRVPRQALHRALPFPVVCYANAHSLPASRLVSSRFLILGSPPSSSYLISSTHTSPWVVFTFSRLHYHPSCLCGASSHFQLASGLCGLQGLVYRQCDKTISGVNGYTWLFHCHDIHAYRSTIAATRGLDTHHSQCPARPIRTRAQDARLPPPEPDRSIIDTHHRCNSQTPLSIAITL
jgi:hypothetical protein